MTISISRYDEWDKFSKEVEDLDISVQNFTVSINNQYSVMPDTFRFIQYILAFLFLVLFGVYFVKCNE